MSYEHNNNNLILQFKGKIIINIVVIKKNYDKKKNKQSLFKWNGKRKGELREVLSIKREGFPH